MRHEIRTGFVFNFCNMQNTKNIHSGSGRAAISAFIPDSERFQGPATQAVVPQALTQGQFAAPLFTRSLPAPACEAACLPAFHTSSFKPFSGFISFLERKVWVVVFSSYFKSQFCFFCCSGREVPDYIVPHDNFTQPLLSPAMGVDSEISERGILLLFFVSLPSSSSEEQPCPPRSPLRPPVIFFPPPLFSLGSTMLIFYGNY